jgi:IS30 family transposase
VHPVVEVDNPSADLLIRLDRIANLMALTLVRGLEEGEQIRVLDAVGYTPTEIGSFLGKRPNTVSVALTRQRRKPGGSRKTTSRKKSMARDAGRKRKTAARRKRQ